MSDELPQGAVLKDISAHYNHLTIPRELRVPTPLPPEIWAKLVVEEGSVQLRMGAEAKTRQVPAEAPAVIPRDTPFSLEAAGEPARFYLEYYHEPTLADSKALANMLGRRGNSGAPSGT